MLLLTLHEPFTATAKYNDIWFLKFDLRNINLII